jgi:transposase
MAKQTFKIGQSPRHVWDNGYPVTTCKRCGAHFSYNGMDAHGPIYCVPTPAWLAANPNDDRKER